MKHAIFSRENPKDVERIPITPGTSLDVLYAKKGVSRPLAITINLPSQFNAVGMLSDSGDVIGGRFEELMPTVPDTLRSFQKWSDSLDEHHIVVYFPTSVFAKAEVVEKPYLITEDAKIYSNGEMANLLMSGISSPSFRLPKDVGKVTVKLRAPEYEPSGDFGADLDFLNEGPISVEFVVSSYSSVGSVAKFE